MERARKKLDEPNRVYQEYLRTLALWSKRRAEIEGLPNTVGGVVNLQARIAELEQLPQRCAAFEAKRGEIVNHLFAAKADLLERYRSLYSPVQLFILNHPVSREYGGLQFFATIVERGFVDGLLKMIHQGRKGSFQGEIEGRERLEGLVAAASFDTEAGVRAFIESIRMHLDFDCRDGLSRPVALKDQLRQGFVPADVLSYVYGLEYLRPRFELRWQGKPLASLSPGERGNLLLVFYLLIDRRTVPLVIDQPEENLDNQTIAQTLVPAVKYARRNRQVILVTHNPNLAVVCDADQVIHTSLNKAKGNEVVYTSGSIEDPTINQLIVDVLEGTRPAFDLRDAKYALGPPSA
jgi:hypothetical protein